MRLTSSYGSIGHGLYTILLILPYSRTCDDPYFRNLLYDIQDEGTDLRMTTGITLAQTKSCCVL